LSLDAVREYQARLRAEGFSAEELKAARTIKLSDGEIEENRRERIAANPARLAGSTMSAATEYAAALRNVGKWYASLPAVVVPWSEGTVREQRQSNLRPPFNPGRTLMRKTRQVRARRENLS